MSANTLEKFRRTYKLKQHTPLIHFQSDQPGATLRATELKPKLDRFLIEQFKKEGIEYRDLLIKNQEGALDYRVTLSPDMSSSTSIETTDHKGKKRNHPLFFGNMGDGKEKRFKKHEQTFEMTFFSYKPALISAIDAAIEAFFANENFGTRQSKGFGSFYPAGRKFDKSLVGHRVYRFSTTSEKWAEDLRDFYSFLRAGINTANFRGIYAKAVIFAYAKAEGITWDKKAIKQHYMQSELQKQQQQHPDPNGPVRYEGARQHLMRDLFGLSSTQEWKSYRATVEKEDTAKEMERFKSPLTFKPIQEGDKMYIYFWADRSVEKMLNREFLIKVNRRGDLRLKTPSAFSFDTFFDFAFGLDLSKYIDPKYHNNSQYKKLARIFREIKESK
jgi:hypothetical protein